MTDVAPTRERVTPFLLGILCTLVLLAGGGASVVAGLDAVIDDAFCTPVPGVTSESSASGGLDDAQPCENPPHLAGTLMFPPLLIAPAAILVLWVRLRRPDRPRLWAGGIGIGLLFLVWLTADWIAPGRFA